MPRTFERLQLIAELKVLVTKPFILQSELFHLVVFMPKTSITAAETRRNAHKKTSNKYAERESCQKWQHSDEKTLGTHDTSYAPETILRPFDKIHSSDRP